jgi:4'-phosphopantetheinyl transferase
MSHPEPSLPSSAHAHETRDIDADEAVVWLQRPRPFGGVDLARLSADEVRRVERFRFERDRDSYASAHALLRTALSDRVPAHAPQDWRFETELGGRPELTGALRATGLRFSLSHTRGLVACVVTSGRACGVDVEDLARGVDAAKLARRVLSPSERAQFAATHAADRQIDFVRRWTLKEAYTKATGRGLSTPFDTLTFDIEPTIVLRAIDGTGVVPGFQFAQQTFDASHVVAVAIAGDTPVRVRVRVEQSGTQDLGDAAQQPVTRSP